MAQAQVSVPTLTEQMHATIKQAIPSGDFVPALVASKVVAHLRRHDPDFLLSWLEERAESMVRIEIDRMLRSERTRARTRQGPRAFAQAVDSGDLMELSIFAIVRYVVDDKNTRRPLGDMTGEDHLFVADRYAASGNRQLMLNEFHRAVAKKVGRKTTKEALTEVQYRKLEYQMLGGFDS